jgi:hypothetical protein
MVLHFEKQVGKQIKPFKGSAAYVSFGEYMIKSTTICLLKAGIEASPYTVTTFGRYYY